MVTAPSQHAAAVVWWGRCPPFKLCLSPPVGHSLHYLHFWGTVLVSGISSYKMVKCIYVTHVHSHTNTKKNPVSLKNSQVIYYESCPHISCCAKKCNLNSNEYSQSLTGLTNLNSSCKLTLSYTPAFLTFTCIHDKECNLFCKYCSPKQPVLIVTLSYFLHGQLLKDHFT